MIILLIAEGQNFEPYLLTSYNIALTPFMEMAPFFFAALSFVFYSGKYNTTASWLLVATSNILFVFFWLLLIVPFFVNLAFPGSISSSCPDSVSVNGLAVPDDSKLCHLRKGAAALSCALAFIEFLWFITGMIQTMRLWNSNYIYDSTFMSGFGAFSLTFLFLEMCGIIIWLAGNLRLVKLGRDNVTTFSDQELIGVTYFLLLIAIVSMILTAYAIVDGKKFTYGITTIFHLCAFMMFWSIFVWDARGSRTPSIWLGPNSSAVDNAVDKVIASGLGIVTVCETIFTVCFWVAYMVKPEMIQLKAQVA